MIYLIGVEHKVQSVSVGGEETADQIKYRLYLEQAIEEYKPTVVAEEYSEDALSRSAYLRGIPQEFFTRKIATPKGVKHLPCDSDLRTKCSMGYQGSDGWRMQIPRLEKCDSSSDHEPLPDALEVTKDFPPRENYWLEQLKDILQEEIIFVCGDYHVDTFGSRLKNNGIKSRVVARQIGMPTELIERLKKVREYIDQNAQHIERVYQEILKLNSGKIRSPFCFDEDEVVASPTMS